MPASTDLPPTRTIEPLDPAPPPPEDDNPNMAMLKGDINSGRTGDKVPVFDPGMAMLGTCEEAAGTPLTPEQIKTARLEETRHRWRFGRPLPIGTHNKADWAHQGFIGLIVVIGAAILGGVWLLA